MEQKSGKKKTAGRPPKNIKKTINASVRYSNVEYLIIKGKAKKCGLPVSSYIRQSSIQQPIKPRLTDEEILIVRQLVGMSNNMNQMAKTCHREGLFTSMVYFETVRGGLDALLKKLKS